MKPIVPALLVSLALSACAAGAPDTVATSAMSAPAATPAAAQVPAVAPPPSAPAAAPVGDLAAGKRAFEQGCFSCHDQATILAQGGRTKGDWQDVVTMMQDRGFSGSSDEVKLIVDYLAATYPPKG
jgi:cytochrome c5